jgi:adenylosuccinate synthase
MNKKAFVVIGLGFGDEGKGLTTDFLARQHPNALVIRFNGGQQAGHTVSVNGKRHVFSHFGSGTLRGIPTYWSGFCTFSPGAMLNEYRALQAINAGPVLWIDKLCPVSTHYDVLYNRTAEAARGEQKHGSCGMGFGATLQRQADFPLKFFAQDLFFEEITAYKLNAIREYYRRKLKAEFSFNFDSLDHDAEDNRFLAYTEQLKSLENQKVIRLVSEGEIFRRPFDTFIFEAAQGVLLDMDFGFFPHVTRSHTTSRNALELIGRNLKNEVSPEIFYVSRCYHTRHGEGPFMQETTPLILKNNADETNRFNEHQGNFRTAPLNIDLLRYALACDGNFSSGLTKNLMLTCLDQLDREQVPVFLNKILQTVAHEKIPLLAGGNFRKVICSFSPEAP